MSRNPQTSQSRYKKMLERAKTKKQNGKGKSQQPEENAEVYGIDASVELGKDGVQRTGRGIKKTVKGGRKAVKTVKRIRGKHKARRAAKETAQKATQQRGRMKLQRQRIKTRRIVKPPSKAAFPMERQKNVVVKKRRDKLKTRKAVRPKMRKLGKAALLMTASKSKFIVKKAKNAAKSAMTQKQADTADAKGLDETLAYGQTAAGMAGSGIKEAARYAKKVYGKRRFSASGDGSTSQLSPELRAKEAAQRRRSDTNRLPAYEGGNPSIAPKQRGKMETAKSRSSLAKQCSAIKDRANAANMQPKGSTSSFKTVGSKHKQIKKARVAQQETRQKAQQVAHAAAKRSYALMKQVAEAAAATVKSIIAGIGGAGLFIVLFLLVFIIGFLAASPFGMFMSDENPKNGKPLAQVIRELDGELRASASTGDELDSEGETVASNWMDVIAVFAVKTTTTTTDKALDVGVMDEERIQKLREVLFDMNEVTTRTETETYLDENGDEQTRTKTITSVEGKTWQEMIPIYNFDRDQQALLEELMGDEYFDMFMMLLGEAGLSSSPMTSEELQDIINNLPPASDTAAAEVLRLAASRLGHPYSQKLRGQGNYVDCSYFVRWIYRHFGIEMPGTAADQAEWCAENGLAIAKSDLQPGDLVFWSYGDNGRYRGIDHVGVYIGNGMVIDASSSKGKVVMRNIFDSGNQVMYGRPLAFGG